MLLGIPIPVLVIVLWHFGVTYQWELIFGIRMGFLPYPADVAVTLWDFAFGGLRNDASSGEPWVNLGASLGRVAAGFALALVLAIPLGIFRGWFYVVNSLFDALLNLVRPIPATVWVPLVALPIGIGDPATIFLITLSAVFPIVLGTISGAR